MKILGEEPLRHKRQLRETSVQGRDGKYFRVVSIRLYDQDPPAEFPNFEVTAYEVDEKGKRYSLTTHYLKRFMSETDARKNHDNLIADFDNLLGIPEPPPPKHAPPPKQQ